MSESIRERTSGLSLATASVSTIMTAVILALMPGTALYAYFFGAGVLINVALACVSALLFEAVMLTVRGVPVARQLLDGSALLTAMLLALSLPPLVPWWIPVLGSFIAIVVAKQLYGGLGNNPFNPAMAAFAVLLIAFPLEMSQWLAPVAHATAPLQVNDAIDYTLGGSLPGAQAIDAYTAATPLDRMRTELALGEQTPAIQQAEVFGTFAGFGIEWVSVAYLLGGVALVLLRVISWHIPVAMLAMLGVAAWLGSVLAPDASMGPMLHLFGGATMLGAFFIATDPVTAATTRPGKLLYGAVIGLLVFAIRTWGSYPDGVAFGVLLGGMLVPILDRYALPSVFGARKRHEHTR